LISELQEFGTFNTEVQRYICRSLNVGLFPDVTIAAEWARDDREAADIDVQREIYGGLSGIRSMVPANDVVVDAEAFLLPLIAITAFDLTVGPISSFVEYRFLYERLLGPEIRRWLPAAFIAAAALPHLPAEVRRVLVASASGAISSEWSNREPSYFPRWLCEFESMAA
jgi:hypothetical protein